ncbi:MAG: ribosomal protein S18-alanine N-acetyltransferase [Acetatifactor sp.]|nr:ribosomal protein S18-alanine N-acetyltransferase [Acetatifactor sp.]
MELLIRPFCAEDIEEVSALDEKIFTRPWSRSDYEKLLTKDYYLYLVALENGRIVGFCGMINVCGEGDIDRVMVDEKYRNQSIANQMLTHLLKLGDLAGIEAYTLEVRAGNAAAIHVYEKLGFVSEGIRPGFYDRPVEDAVIMWRRQ